MTTSRYSGTPSCYCPCSVSAHSSCWGCASKHISAAALTSRKCANYAVARDCVASETRHYVFSTTVRKWSCRLGFRHIWRRPNSFGCTGASGLRLVPSRFPRTNCAPPQRWTSASFAPRAARGRRAPCRRRGRKCRRHADGGRRKVADGGDWHVVAIDCVVVCNLRQCKYVNGNLITGEMRSTYSGVTMK